MLRVVVATLMCHIFLVGTVQAEQFIIGGEMAVPGQFPYVSLLKIVSSDEKVTYASGTTISDWYILTDAYSLTGDVSYINATFGATNLLDPTEPNHFHMTISFGSITFHPSFKTGAFLYSIATVKLPKRLQFTHQIQLAFVPRKSQIVDDFSSQQANVTGYGKTQFLNPPEKDPEHLRYRSLDVLTNDECARMVDSEPGKFEPELICTVSAVGLYDNGSPLTVVDVNGRPTLIGTLSHTFNKVSGFKVTTLNLYTRITKMLDFVEATTNVKILN